MQWKVHFTVFTVPPLPPLDASSESTWEGGQCGLESPGKDCELVRRLDAKGGRQLRRRSPQAQKMSRYPSAYGHTPTYRSVGSTVYPSALGRDPLDVPVFENTKTKDRSVYTQCVATLKAMLVLNIWFTPRCLLQHLPFSGEPLCWTWGPFHPRPRV